MAASIRMNPMHASMTGFKPPSMSGAPGAKATLGHFATPEILGAGHNNSKMPRIKTGGSFHGKSNKLGHGGRAAQLKAKGVPGGVIGNLARKAQAAPGQKNYHGS